MKKKHLIILNSLGLTGVIIVNYLANALPINGKNTGEISALYPTLFTPAGFTFSIWGLIYLALIAFIVYQLSLLKVSEDDDNDSSDFVLHIGFFYLMSCVANIGWIWCWHHELIGISMGVMLFLLWTLMSIYYRLGIGLENNIHGKLRYLVHLPFSLYLGWISVATIANFAIFLKHDEWFGFGVSEEWWTVIMILVAAALAIFMLFKRADMVYNAVILWAFLGIILARSSGPTESKAIVGLGTLIAGIILLALLYKIILAVFFPKGE